MRIADLRWRILFSLIVASAMAPLTAFAQTPVPPVLNPCPRFTAGSVVQQPPALFSHNGVLNVRFSYQTTTDPVGRQLFCFMTPNGLENPTLRVNPGDTLNITVTNNTPASPVGGEMETDKPYDPPNCGDTTQRSFVLSPVFGPPPPPAAMFGMTGGSMNIHYHGTNVSPQCHGDNVTKTLINPGSTFQYNTNSAG